MDWLAQHGLKLILVVGYLALLAYHTWIAASARGKSGEKSNAPPMPAWMLALSYYATFVSTNTFIGHAGKSWDVGLIWYVKALFYLAFVLIAWRVLAPRYVTVLKGSNAQTLAGVLGVRYESMLLRKLSAAVILLAAVLFMTAVYGGSSLALQEFFGLDYRAAAVVIFLIVTGYTAAGGYRAVVHTDVVQGLLLAVGAVAVLVGVLIKGGGLPTILQTLHEQDPELLSWHGKLPLATVIGLALAGGIKMVVDPRQVERFNGLGEAKAARGAGTLVLVLIVITYLCLLPIGAFAHALIPAEAIRTSDEVMPRLLGHEQILGAGLSSIFLMVLFAGAMSSLDSVLLVAAMTVHHDLLPPRQGPGRPWVWIVLLSLGAMLLAFQPIGDVVEITAFSGSIYAACFLPTLLLGLYWKRGTAAGALVCVIAGSVTVVAWYIASRAGWTDWHEIYAGIAVGLATYAGISLLPVGARPGERSQSRQANAVGGGSPERLPG